MDVSDTQFKAFLRFAIYALHDAANEPDEKSKDEKLRKILDISQRSLED